jgi:hypothetical protein
MAKRTTSSTRTKRPGRPRKRPLQGERLRKAASARLEQMVSLSPKTVRITLARLARDLGVSRPALYNNGFNADVIREYCERQRANFDIATEAEARRAPLERRAKSAENEKEDLRRKLDQLAQWWVYWAQHAINHGIAPELMFPEGGPADPDWPVPVAPDIPQPQRRGRRKTTRR